MEQKDILTLKEFIDRKVANLHNVYECIVDYNGYKMHAMITGQTENQCEHFLWDDTGSRSIYKWNKDLDIPYEKLIYLIESKRDGIKVCNKCLNPITGEAHYDCAGTYCDDCWTPEMQREWLSFLSSLD